MGERSMPDHVRAATNDDVEAQRVHWRPERWREVFAGYGPLYQRLRDHIAKENGIARYFVHGLAAAEPMELFLASMAWGWGTVGYGPYRVGSIIKDAGNRRNIATIIDTVREGKVTDGSPGRRGWKALLGDNRVPGLGMAFGTKLLYFAGYTLTERPRPLILDARVRRDLVCYAGGTVAPIGSIVTGEQYEAYLELAEEWSGDPRWGQGPDVVEYALFQNAGAPPGAAEKEHGDDDAIE